MTPRCRALLHGAAVFMVVLIAVVVMAPRAHAIVDIKEVESPGGIKAWLVEDHSLPIVTVNFAFRGGAALDPAGKEGLAYLTSGLLNEGAGNLRSQEYQRILNDLAIELEFDAGRDGFYGGLKTLKENKAKAFEMLRLALTKPRFDFPAVERVRAQVLSSLKRRLEDPDRVAARLFFARAFPDHPYGRPVRGTLDSVRRITANDLHTFVRQRFSRANLIVSAVGDITPGQLGEALDEIFGELPENGNRAVVADTSPKAAGNVMVVRKNVPQSAIIFGHGAYKRDHPDFYAAYLMNHILGGGSFSSRIFKEVREKRGLAYSTYSNLVPLDHTGLIIGGAGTANARVSETVTVIKEQWKKMAEQGVTADELKNAKRYLTGSYPLRFTSSRRISRILTGVQLERLGIDYINERNRLIEAVTLEDVQKTARKLLDTGALTFVVVGNPEDLAGLDVEAVKAN